jgi:hypothetical protein
MQKHVDWSEDTGVWSTGQHVPCNTNRSPNFSTACRYQSCGNLKINRKIEIFAIKTYKLPDRKKKLVQQFSTINIIIQNSQRA